MQNKKYNLVALPGDGIGPSITEAALKVLTKTGELFGFEFSVEEALIGGIAIDKTGNPLPPETLELCKKSDAVLLGAVGGPQWDVGKIRPEQGLLGIRAGLGLFANLRPAIVYNALKDASPLKDHLLAGGLDILVVRELTGGIYFGKRERLNSQELGEYAYDTELYSKSEIIRIAKLGFESAQKRSKKLCSVDKANILDSSKLWRETVIELSKDYPDVELTHMYVDNAAMQLVRMPSQFDVIVTSNIFGDILSDEASQITGSIGMLPSASLGSTKIGLYEPIHGSAPDIAGKNLANPLATILSVAMMLRYSLDEIQAADAIEAAVQKALDAGYRTGDIAQKGDKTLGTIEMTEKVLEFLKK